MGKLMLLVEESAYRPSSWVIPLSSFFAASLFIDDDVFCFLEEEAWCAADSARGVTMAVALATLPLKRVLAGAGDTCFAAATGAALAGALATGLTALAAGLAATLGAGLATGLAAGFATAVFLAITLAGFATDFAAALRVLTAIGLPLLAAGLVATDFFGATFFATTLLAGAFFTGTFFTAAFLATTFFAAGALAALDFFAGDLTTGFLGSDLGAAFFAVGLAAALGFAMVFGAALTDVLPALFTAAPLPALLPDEALPFCALAAVELRVVFAISLHRLWPWRPGVIAHVSCTSKLASEILVPLPDASRCSPVNIPTRFILWLLRLYKRWLSPLLGPRCRFHPSCSDYARIAVTRFGPWRGSLLTGWRLLRCQPLCEGGEDPVPEHFRYPRCRCKSNSHDLH